MRAWFRMFFVVSGLGAALASTEAAQITISGHVAQPPRWTNEPAPDSTIPYWELLDMERAMPTKMLVVGPYSYGTGFGLTRAFSRPNVFRYHNQQYSAIRYPRLRTLTQRDRLGGRQRYQPGVKYTRSFNSPAGFRTNLKYGFQ